MIGLHSHTQNKWAYLSAGSGCAAGLLFRGGQELKAYSPQHIAATDATDIRLHGVNCRRSNHVTRSRNSET
jgi:hypothetical protein